MNNTRNAQRDRPSCVRKSVRTRKSFVPLDAHQTRCLASRLNIFRADTSSTLTVTAGLQPLNKDRTLIPAAHTIRHHARRDSSDNVSSLPLVTNGVRGPLVHVDFLRLGLEKILPSERDESAAPRGEVGSRVDGEEAAEAEQFRHGAAHPRLLSEPETDPVVVDGNQLLVVFVHHWVVGTHLFNGRLVLLLVTLRETKFQLKRRTHDQPEQV